jgi:hypothetical protein
MDERMILISLLIISGSKMGSMDWSEVAQNRYR